MMHCTATDLPGVMVLEPRVFEDERGFFFESFNERQFSEAIDQQVTFVQDNHSRSVMGVLRGLHYQLESPQGKLVRVVRGTVFDVAVDVRRSSPTFGRWVGVQLDAPGQRQVWIPPGFAHGFLVLSESADVLYKTTDFYAPEHEETIRWDDPAIGIDWPIADTPIVSEKDAAGRSLETANVFP